MQLPKNIIDKILSESITFAKAEGDPASMKHKFYAALNDALQEIAFQHGKEFNQFFSDALHQNPALAEGLNAVEMAADKIIMERQAKGEE